jgi:type I restriction enzyme M protein
LTADDKEESDLLNHYLQLIENSAEASKKLKEAQKELNDHVTAKYTVIRNTDLVALLLDDKWFATLAAIVDAEVQDIASQFTNRIKELAERYAAPLPEQMQTVDELTGKVNVHLKKMGFTWK